MKIHTKNSTYRICEIEFYLFDKFHPDSYTHRDKEQLNYGTFYFHRMNGKGFKAGTYKCFDLAFGDETENKYFGVLVRSIMNISTGQFYEGPCRSLTALLAEYGCTEVKEFVGARKAIDLFANDQELCISFENSQKIEEIWSGPRIGLSDKYPDFKSKNYRYLIFEKKIKKSKKNLVKLNIEEFKK